jgi:hypothetical protein
MPANGASDVSFKLNRIFVGLSVAVASWAISVVGLFFVLTIGEPRGASHPTVAVTSIIASGVVPIWVSMRYSRSTVRQEGSVLYVKNPFRSFTFDIGKAKGFVDIERRGGRYTALVPETGRRPVRIIGLSFPPSLDGIDLGELPFINLVDRRVYW